MPIHSATAVSQNIDDSFRAGLDLGAKLREKLPIDEASGSLGVLFAGIEFDVTALVRGVREMLPIPIIGCTTGSEANTEGHFEESASLLVMTSSDLRVGVGIGENLSREPERAVNTAMASARAGLDGAEPALVLILPDCALSGSADLVLRHIVSVVGRNVPIVGGLPGDGLRFTGMFQFCNDRVASDAVAVALLGGPIEVLVVTRSGWVPVGRRAKATKVNGNVLLEVDGQPAGDYFKRYIPTMTEPSVNANFPLAILDHSLDDEDGKHFVIRSPFFYDQNTGSVTYNGDIPLNSQIQLARGTQDDILRGAREAARTLRRRALGRPTEALLCFSCVGRKLMLGLDTKREVEIILEELPIEGGKPPVMNGFYTYGEIGPIDSSRSALSEAKFHNTTLVLCGIFSLPQPSANIVSPPSRPAITFASGSERASAVEAENEKLKAENARLSRSLRRLEGRVELMDKVSRGREQVGTSLYSELERLSAELEAEKRRVDTLITNMLPQKIAERLKTKGGTIAETYDEATVLFADLVGFTALAERIPPERTVDLLNNLFSAFDDLADRYGVEKIKTIGDAYMIAGGLPEPRRDHAAIVAAMALEMPLVVSDIGRRLGLPLEVRAGMHCGPVVAGVIGKRKFVYDLWGDTVNTAARLESHGLPSRIQVSEAAYARLHNDFDLEERGEVVIKDKGRMKTWFLIGPKSTMSVRGVPFFF